MIVIGLTGSIGMGKSTAAAMLEGLGIPVHHADAEVHALLGEGGKGLEAFQATFPRADWPGVYTPGGGIDRKTLGETMFRNPVALDKLEQILHPLVREAQKNFLMQQKNMGCKIAVLDIPLLFEKGGEKRVTYTLVVTAPHFVQKTRVMKRLGMDKEKFHAILKRQMPDDEKRKRADFVVQTGFGKAFTRCRIRQIIAAIKKKEGLA